MKIRKRVADITPHLSAIRDGKGFYAACKAEMSKNLTPSQQAVNALKELFMLLNPPGSQNGVSDNVDFQKMAKLINRCMLVYDEGDMMSYILKLKHSIMRIAERSRVVKEEHRKDSEMVVAPVAPLAEPLPEVPQNNTPVNAPAVAKLDENQKNILYNMLLAKGLSHEEALNEIINL